MTNNGTQIVTISINLREIRRFRRSIQVLVFSLHRNLIFRWKLIAIRVFSNCWTDLEPWFVCLVCHRAEEYLKMGALFQSTSSILIVSNYQKLMEFYKFRQIVSCRMSCSKLKLDHGSLRIIVHLGPKLRYRPEKSCGSSIFKWRNVLPFLKSIGRVVYNLCRLE